MSFLSAVPAPMRVPSHTDGHTLTDSEDELSPEEAQMVKANAHNLSYYYTTATLNDSEGMWSLKDCEKRRKCNSPAFFPLFKMFSEAYYLRFVNPLPDNKILDQTKLKAFADDKLNVTKMIISVFDRVENIVGKRRNCLYKQFLLFPQCFLKASFPDASKGVIE